MHGHGRYKIHADFAESTRNSTSPKCRNLRYYFNIQAKRKQNVDVIQDIHKHKIRTLAAKRYIHLHFKHISTYNDTIIWHYSSTDNGRTTYQFMHILQKNKRQINSAS
jgi:trans-aconitate methyltransferase